MPDPISRADLIRAGAPIYIEKPNAIRWAAHGILAERLPSADLMEQHGVVLHLNTRYRHMFGLPMVRLSVDGIDGHGTVLVVMQAATTEELHERLAKAIEAVDPEGADALRSPEPLCRDACLFVAAADIYADRCKAFLAMGADPLRRTPDGDCAARVGIAHGLLAEFGRWWSAKNLRTGETGLHHLARYGDWQAICQVIDWGGNLHEPNHAGVSPADGMTLRPSGDWDFIQSALDRAALNAATASSNRAEKPRRRM